MLMTHISSVSNSVTSARVIVPVVKIGAFIGGEKKGETVFLEMKATHTSSLRPVKKRSNFKVLAYSALVLP